MGHSRSWPAHLIRPSGTPCEAGSRRFAGQVAFDGAFFKKTFLRPSCSDRSLLEKVAVAAVPCAFPVHSLMNLIFTTAAEERGLSCAHEAMKPPGG